RRAGVLGETDGAVFLLRPRLPEIVAGAHHRTEVEVLGRGPQPPPASAAVVGHRVDGLPREIRPAPLPPRPQRVRTEEERALRRADHDESVAALRGNVAYVDHGDPPPVATR